MSHVEDEGSERPKLVLQPRGSPNGTPSTTPRASRPNPFGAARPREQVIAEREGKQETDVLKEQAKKEWNPQIALTEAQREEKKAAEAELAFAKNELENEEDEEKASSLREEVLSKERKLEELIASFEKVGVQSAQSSSTRRPFEKRREENPQPMQYSGFVGREGSLGDSSFGNFRGRARDNSNDRFYSYGDTWGGARRAGGQSECYTCGEIGHFSRECPRGGSYGATFGGGGGRGGGGSRSCYTCGQEGHFSRDCPQSSSFGSRSGGYGGAQSFGGAVGGNHSGYGSAEYGGSYNNNGYTAGYYDERGEYVGQGGR